MARLVWRTGKFETVFRIFQWGFLSLGGSGSHLAFVICNTSYVNTIYSLNHFIFTSYLLLMLIDLNELLFLSNVSAKQDMPRCRLTSESQ